MAIIVNSPSAKVEFKNQDQFDIWTSVKSSTAKNDDGVDRLAQPYVHPMLRRSASFMSQASLDSCTEGLGSETGSDRFVDFDDFDCYSCSDDDSEDEEKEEEEFGVEVDSIGGSFPPPISSIRHREMRVQRRDGRLVVESVAVGSRKKSLCCQRQDGRLLLSFLDDPVANRDTEFEKEDEDEDEDDDEEEEVEVVDRGIVVEVKIHRSTSFVINKFVGVDINTMEPEKPEDKNPPEEKPEDKNPPEEKPEDKNPPEEEPDISGLKWVPPEIMSTAKPDLPNQMAPKKVTSVKKRESILEHMKKRCNLELNRPPFILEPCYVAAVAT